MTNSWNCPNCGIKEITSRFCPGCGTKKPEPETWDCPNCGNKEIKSKFCPECGTKRSGTEISLPAVPKEIEQITTQIEKIASTYGFELPQSFYKIKDEQLSQINQLKELFTCLKSIRNDFIPKKEKNIETGLLDIDKKLEDKKSIIARKNQMVQIINSGREKIRDAVKNSAPAKLNELADKIEDEINAYKPKTQINFFSLNSIQQQTDNLSGELWNYTSALIEKEIIKWTEQDLKPVISIYIDEINFNIEDSFNDHSEVSFELKSEDVYSFLNSEPMVLLPPLPPLHPLLAFKEPSKIIESTKKQFVYYNRKLLNSQETIEKIATAVFEQTESFFDSLPDELKISYTEESISAEKETEKAQLQQETDKIRQLKYAVNDIAEEARELIYKIDPDVKYSELRLS